MTVLKKKKKINNGLTGGGGGSGSGEGRGGHLHINLTSNVMLSFPFILCGGGESKFLLKIAL